MEYIITIVLYIQYMMKNKINVYAIHYMAIGTKMNLKEMIYIVKQMDVQMNNPIY